MPTRSSRPAAPVCSTVSRPTDEAARRASRGGRRSDAATVAHAVTLADDAAAEPVVADWPNIASSLSLAERANRVRFDGWELQRHERQLRSPDGLPVALSNAEFQLLATFLRSPRRVVSRDDLAQRARGRALATAGRSIDLPVSRLRQKLGATAGAAPLIRSVRGVGSLFDARSVEALA